MPDRITIRKPDDWHLHVRDNDMLKAALPFTARHFGRAILMPNLIPPVRTTADAIAYRERVMAALPRGSTFKPLLTCYLTDDTDPDDVERGFRDGIFTGVKLYPADIEQTISFRTRAEPILDLKIFDSLAKATAAHQQLELTYRKPGQRQTETRIVDPYHLANINGEWFLFAHCHLRNDIRTFVPARILQAKPTGRAFVRPPKFSLQKRLRDSFGVLTGPGEFDVVVRFDELAADYIREKRWHPSQQLTESEDGGVQLRLKLSSLAEIQRWILSWGGRATVLAPVELAQSVKAAARAILDKTE